MQNTKIHSLRFQPQQDLKKGLMDWAQTQKIKAATIVTCVGSLKSIHLRLAAGREGVKFQGPQEIVSLVGTFSMHGSHFHISLANDKGLVVGGHLLDGNLVHTTAEIVILEIKDKEFIRELDHQTGFLELKIK